ncbi:cupin-like domain-containing protein [Caulobacter sp. BK020]|uniref:cupin-like domain-containing protein n=1 Tax=Caulobacter sp. BK020 TaxID=2512117 RepID=UPI0010483AFE|nr:cupin-like domain-containing protein [Caulobacter sp. BK020]TCS10306.1 cupin-like protein [Caulobacter sp. BK020]
MTIPTQIPELDNVTPERFRDEVVPAARPVVMRGLVGDWPVVAAGRTSPAAICDYLRRFDQGQQIKTVSGPPRINGRFFYNDDLSGFNFQQQPARVSTVLDFLLEHLGDERPPALAAQSITSRDNLPGFSAENRLGLVADTVDPRLWIGNAVTVATHYDPAENIACVVAGRREFTLFPPDQISNLYVGPMEMTPAGATISLVALDEADPEVHPRFAAARAASMTAELEPGDAIYIPYLWWHHVRSLEPINVLVNYWWTPPSAVYGAPRDAMMHAILAIKALPPAHRQAWQAVFSHYVFQAQGDPGEHLPPKSRGVLGPITPDQARNLRTMLARALGRP